MTKRKGQRFNKDSLLDRSVFHQTRQRLGPADIFIEPLPFPFCHPERLSELSSGQLLMRRAIVGATEVPLPLTQALSSSNRPFPTTTLSFLSSRAKPRDLQFYGCFVEMFLIEPARSIVESFPM
jgi:hypothetical protein